MTTPLATLAEAAWKAHHAARAPHTVALSWEDLQDSAPATAAAWESAASTLRAMVLADVRAALPELAQPLPSMVPRQRLESLLARMADGTPVPAPLPMGTGGHTVRNVLTGERFHACAVEWSEEGRGVPRMFLVTAERLPGEPDVPGCQPWARDATGMWVPVEVLP